MSILQQLPVTMNCAATISESFGQTGIADAAARLRVYDVVFGNLKQVLGMTDRNSMAHSIEARVPYVDRRIVEYAFTLPDRYKVGTGRTKRILRLIAARYLPREVVGRRDRIGFGAPVERWMREDFREELNDFASDSALARSDLLDAARTRKYVANFLRGNHNDAAAVWRLYAIEQWIRAYSVQGL